MATTPMISPSAGPTNIQPIPVNMNSILKATMFLEQMDMAQKASRGRTSSSSSSSSDKALPDTEFTVAAYQINSETSAAQNKLMQYEDRFLDYEDRSEIPERAMKEYWQLKTKLNMITKQGRQAIYSLNKKKERFEEGIKNREAVILNENNQPYTIKFKDAEGNEVERPITYGQQSEIMNSTPLDMRFITQDLDGQDVVNSNFLQPINRIDGLYSGYDMSATNSFYTSQGDLITNLKDDFEEKEIGSVGIKEGLIQGIGQKGTPSNITMLIGNKRVQISKNNVNGLLSKVQKWAAGLGGDAYREISGEYYTRMSQGGGQIYTPLYETIEEENEDGEMVKMRKIKTDDKNNIEYGWMDMADMSVREFAVAKTLGKDPKKTTFSDSDIPFVFKGKDYSEDAKNQGLYGDYASMDEHVNATTGGGDFWRTVSMPGKGFIKGEKKHGTANVNHEDFFGQNTDIVDKTYARYLNKLREVEKEGLGSFDNYHQWVQNRPEFSYGFFTDFLGINKGMMSGIFENEKYYKKENGKIFPVKTMYTAFIKDNMIKELSETRAFKEESLDHIRINVNSYVDEQFGILTNEENSGYKGPVDYSDPATFDGIAYPNYIVRIMDAGSDWNGSNLIDGSYVGTNFAGKNSSMLNKVKINGGKEIDISDFDLFAYVSPEFYVQGYDGKRNNFGVSGMFVVSKDDLQKMGEVQIRDMTYNYDDSDDRKLMDIVEVPLKEIYERYGGAIPKVAPDFIKSLYSISHKDFTPLVSKDAENVYLVRATTNTGILSRILQNKGKEVTMLEALSDLANREKISKSIKDQSYWNDGTLSIEE